MTRVRHEPQLTYPDRRVPSLIAIERAALSYQLLDLNMIRRGVPLVLRLAVLSNCVPRDFFALFVASYSSCVLLANSY